MTTSYSLNQRILSRGGLILTLLLPLGCDRQAAVTPVEPSSTVESLLAPYAPGAWRLARHELATVVLTISHILIAHDRSSSGESSALRAPGWSPDVPPQRTREEARQLAANVAQKARAAPGEFPALARSYSDDVVTRARGGSLGTWSADLIPPEFLDALGSMKHGDVSRVVETALGFHVLRLRPTPAAEMVAARRILIGYARTTPFLYRNTTPPTRSREQAESLARQVAAEATAKPERFSELMSKFSEHADVLRGGDTGAWSTHDAFVWNRELEAIAALRVGQVSEPIDGPEGFGVYMRLPARARQEVAFAHLDVPYRAQGSLEAVVERIDDARLPADVVAVLHGRAKFELLQGKYCCKKTQQWQEGRGDPRVQYIVGAVDVGGIASRGLLIGTDTIRIFKRVAPVPPVPGKTFSSELPASNGVDVDHLVANAARGEDIARFLKSLQRQLGEGFGLALERDQEQRVAQIATDLENQVRTLPASDRMLALTRARAELRQVLGAEAFAQVQRNIQQEIKRKLIGAR